ncbi:MAG: acetolactate decarboxylase [Pseudomonadota bacterium]
MTLRWMLPIVLLASSCRVPAADAPELRPGDRLAEVQSVGDRRAIMQGALDGRIQLNELRHLDGLYAIGPVSGLRGEITIADGVPHVSVLNAERLPVELPTSAAWEASAIFLAYAASAELGSPTRLPKVISLTALREHFERVAAEHGIALEERPVAFEVRGEAEVIRYHVIWKDGERPHSREEHRKSKVTFERRDVAVRLIGFYSREGEGRYTHPGNPAHIHAVLPGDGEGATVSGHVDVIALAAGAQLYLAQAFAEDEVPP